jgi:hypothetical protein
MRKKKTSLPGILLFGAMALGLEQYPHEGFNNDCNCFSCQSRPEPVKKKKEKRVAFPPAGMKEFYYGTNLVLAINQKNADRKAKKLGYI